MSVSPSWGRVPFGEKSVTDVVRDAAEAAKAEVRRTGFSLSSAGFADRFVAPLLGLYLGYAVARLPEVFPALAIPRLPMYLLLLFMLLLALTVPMQAWERMWHASLAMRCVVGLAILAVVTAPVGIWMAGSIDFIKERYVIAVVIFLCCLVFLRDRRAMRTAMIFYVLCVVAIAIYTLQTYDPHALLLDDLGNVLDPSEVGIERRRVTVGISLDSNDWGAVLATTIPIALWLSSGGWWRRIFWGGAALLLAWAVIPTASRGSLLGLIAVALVLIAVGATGWRRFLLLGMTCAAGLMISLIATEGQLGRFLDFGGDDYNLTNEGRIYFWRQGLVWMIKRPWGYGIDNYPVYFGWLNGPDRAAHSSWVQYGVELGIAGLAIFAILTWSLWKGHKVLRTKALALRQRIGDLAENEATLSGHLLAMLAGTLVTGSFLSNAYYPLMYMALGIAGAGLLGSPLRDIEPPQSATSPPTGGTPGTRHAGVVRLRRPRGATL